MYFANSVVSVLFKIITILPTSWKIQHNETINTALKI